MLRLLLSSHCRPSRHNLALSAHRCISSTAHLSASWVDKVKGVFTGGKSTDESAVSAESFTLLRKWFYRAQSCKWRLLCCLILQNTNRVCGGDEKSPEVGESEAICSGEGQWSYFRRRLREARSHNSISRGLWSYWGGWSLIRCLFTCHVGGSILRLISKDDIDYILT